MTAIDAIRKALARLDAAASLGAVIERNDEYTLANAALIDDTTGPLAGAAITVKDWIDVEGFACEGQLPTRSERRPARDATAIARLRASGAIVIAKTQPGADHAQHGRCLRAPANS